MPPKVTITHSHLPEIELFSTANFHLLHYKWNNDGNLSHRTQMLVMEESARFYAARGGLMDWRRLLRTRMVEGTSLSDAQSLWNANTKRAIEKVEGLQEELEAIPKRIEERIYGGAS